MNTSRRWEPDEGSQLRYTPTGQAVVKFGIRSTASTSTETASGRADDFFNVNAWRNVAVNVAESSPPEPGLLVTGGCSPQLGDEDERSAPRRDRGRSRRLPALRHRGPITKAAKPQSTSPGPARSAA